MGPRGRLRLRSELKRNFDAVNDPTLHRLNDLDRGRDEAVASIPTALLRPLST